MDSKRRKTSRAPTAAAPTTTTARTTTTTRRTRSRSNTPAPHVPALSTSTPAIPALTTIEEGAASSTSVPPAVPEGAAQTNEAGSSSPNTTVINANASTTNASTKTIKKSRAGPANPLDAPSFSTRQQTTTNNTNAAQQLPQPTTGPALSLFSQPPPAFSQPSPAFSRPQPLGALAAAPFNTSFGGTPLNTSFGRTPLNTGTAFGGVTNGPFGGAASSSFISTLSSPTASGNFRETNTVLPATLPKTTALHAPRDSRPHVISDDEDGDEDEFSQQIRASTSRTTLPSRTPQSRITSGPQLSTRPIFPTGDEEDDEEIHDNDLYPSHSRSSRPRPRPRPRKTGRGAERPEPFDKELEYYREMHADGEEAGGRGKAVYRPPRLELLPPHPDAGRAGGAGGGAMRGGGRSQKLARSSATVADLMGVTSVLETSVSYGAAAAAAATSNVGEGSRAAEGSRGPGRSHAGDGTGRHAGAGERGGHAGAGGRSVAGPTGAAGTARHGAVGGAPDTSRGRDAGGVGPHRHSRRRASPVGMSSHPYAFSGLTPSTNSSGNTNAEADANPHTNNPANANPNASNPTTTTFLNVNSNALGLGMGNTTTNPDGTGEGGDVSAGPATQIWRTGFGVLRDIDDDSDDDAVPGRANRSPERSRVSHPASLPANNDGAAAKDDLILGGGDRPVDPAGLVVDEPTDDEDEKVRRMADGRRERWQREADARKVQRKSGKGLGPTTPIKLGRHGSPDDDHDRTPTQASQKVPAFSVAPAPAPVASTSKGALGVGGVVPKVSGRPGLWKSATENVDGPSGAENDVEEEGSNADNRPGHTRADTVASGSNQTVISRLDSAVSQLPALPGIPGSYEGLSGIGGQNELGVSQFEESLPAFRYNSRGTGPALSTIHDEDDNAALGVSFNPYAELGEPTESQRPPRPHSDIVYNSSGNPVARSSGELLRSEPSEILEPLLRPFLDEIFVPAAQQPIPSGSRTSQSTSSSQGRRKIRFGSYDPADDLVSWDNPADPTRDRTGETTGPQLFTREQEDLQRRVKNILRSDDHEGNLAFGRSRQTILDSVVRPVSEIRAASTSASPTRAAVPPPAAPGMTGPIRTTTTGPSIGDEPGNPLIIDSDPPSPTPSEVRIAGRHYVRTVVMPDRDRRRRGVQSDDEEMQGVTVAPLPTYQLPSEGSELGEEEAVADDAQPQLEPQPQPAPQPNGTVLVPNSSGSTVADDNDVEDLDLENAEKKQVMGEWHEDQLDEDSLEDKMEGLFPSRSFISEPPLETTPLGQMLSRQSISTQPSISSLGDMPDNPLSNFSAIYPPNQEAYMRMHAPNVSDAETEPSVYPSQPVRPFGTNFTPFSDGDVLREAAESNPPSNNLSRYPHPDNLSISTDNSVLRSQLYSSKLMAYNSEQAGLKPGDEGYTEPPEDNYVNWAREQGFSDAASTETGASIAPVKGEAIVPNPFLKLLVRMPGESETHLSEEETSRPSGDSFVVIPDSQGEPPLLSQSTSPKAPSKSMKSTDPRRRPAPLLIDNGIHAYSQAGPSRSQTSGTRASPHPAKNRTAWQSTSAKPYIGSPVPSMRSATPAGSFSAQAGGSTTPAPLVNSLFPLPGTSQARSEAEAEIEAELIPETQFSQQVSHASSPSLRTYSPVIQYENHLERLSEEPRRFSGRKPIVLVPGTASPSQASGIISREPSTMATQVSAQAEGDTDEEGLIELSGVVQQDSFGLSGIGGQNECVLETQPEYLETQNESVDASVPEPTIPSFELPDPALPSAKPQQSTTSKRKRGAESTEPVQDLSDKPSPTKKVRTVEPTGPIRRARSSATRSSKAPVSRGPLTTPVPPKRLTDAGRSRKPTAVSRTPPPQPQRKTALSSIFESSSPLSPLPPSSTPAREETVSPMRRPKTYLKGRTLVPDSSASQAGDDEVAGTSGEHAATQTSGTQATQDPMKTLAKSASKSKLGKRKASAASVDPFPTVKSTPLPKLPTRKRAREEAPEDDFRSINSDLSPPPPKKHRRGASTSVTAQPKGGPKPRKPLPRAAASKQPKPGALFISSPRRACQRGGRVFALWKSLYYTATVKESWEAEDDEDETICQLQFDDKTWTELPLSSLYRCELQEGDKVMVPGLKGKALVRAGYVSAVPLWEDRHRVSVRLASIPQEEVAIFDGKKIAVDAQYVREEWEERKATSLEDIGLGDELVRVQEEKERKEAEAKAIGRTIPSAAFLGPPRWKDSPPPPPRLALLPSREQKRPPQATDIHPRLEAPSTTEPSSSKPFADHLIIHALAVNDENGNPLEKDQRAAQKQELTENIERLGGKVANSFGELLQWGGKISDDGDRWIWKAGAIKYVEQPSAPITSKRVKRTPGTAISEPPKIFLVADGPNRATKYLMALAAGIPCIDQGWVRDENVAPWQTYLLPAGQSPSLGHVCSQWVEHTYSERPRTLKAILDEPGAVRKAFKDQKILFTYPSQSGSEIEESQVAYTYAYAALACLMGASRVEVVHDIDAASRNLEQYDAIVHEDESLPAPLLKFATSKKGKNVTCTDINWVRDCLITGTFLRHCKSQ